MYISLNIDEFNINNVILTEPMRNTVIDNSNFIRIMYSSENLTLNGIFLNCDIEDYNIDFYFQKYKCIFDIKNNVNFMNKISNFEETLLNSISITNKNKKKNVTEQINTGSIKLFIEDNNITSNDSTKIILKISGIWESETEYGITYKFILVNHQL